MYKCIISALVLIYDFKNSAKLTVSSVADKKKLNKKTEHCNLTKKYVCLNMQNLLGKSLLPI